MGRLGGVKRSEAMTELHGFSHLMGLFCGANYWLKANFQHKATQRNKSRNQSKIWNMRCLGSEWYYFHEPMKSSFWFVRDTISNVMMPCWSWSWSWRWVEKWMWAEIWDDGEWSSIIWISINFWDRDRSLSWHVHLILTSLRTRRPPYFKPRCCCQPLLRNMEIPIPPSSRFLLSPLISYFYLTSNFLHNISSSSRKSSRAHHFSPFLFHTLSLFLFLFLSNLHYDMLLRMRKDERIESSISRCPVFIHTLCRCFISNSNYFSTFADCRCIVNAIAIADMFSIYDMILFLMLDAHV